MGGGPGYHWPGPGWPSLAPPPCSCWLDWRHWGLGLRASGALGPPWGSTWGGRSGVAGGWREVGGGGRWWEVVVPHSPPWLTSDPWPRGRELNPGVWCTRPHGAPGPMVHQVLWCTRSYDAPGPMVHQVLWCTRRYSAPGPIVHQVLWCTRSYGAQVSMVYQVLLYFLKFWPAYSWHNLGCHLYF